MLISCHLFCTFPACFQAFHGRTALVDCNSAWCLCAEKQLLSSRPELVAQWHPTENVGQTPDTVTVGSRFSGTWVCDACPCGHRHIWTAKVCDRAGSLNTGCPVCTGKKPCVCGSLARRHPEVAAQWDHARNGTLQPEQLRPSSNKVVHWLCPSHTPPSTWTAAIATRTKMVYASGCPACALERRRRPHAGRAWTLSYHAHQSLRHSVPRRLCCRGAPMLTSPQHVLCVSLHLTACHLPAARQWVHESL